jgi:hypothetical protein
LEETLLLLGVGVLDEVELGVGEGGWVYAVSEKEGV